MTVSSAPLRVAQLVETLGVGGAEALAVDIAGALAGRGHQSSLVAVRGEGDLRGRIEPGVAFEDLAQPRPRYGAVGAFSCFFSVCQRLEALLRARRVEILQTHLPMANFIGLAMSLRGVCRVYPTVHNNREFDYGVHPSVTRRAIRRAAYRRMPGNCQGILAVSEQVKVSFVEQLGLSASSSAHIHVVRNGVRVAAMPTDEKRVELRAALGVGEQHVLIVGVGRLTAQKNFSCLIEALQLMPKMGTDWRCVIAGDGELRADLDRQIVATGLADRVRLAGIVSDMQSLLAAADVFCLPSLYEGMPLALLEAMGTGLPAVAFRIGGVVDVVTDGIQGKLAVPEDVRGLAAALASLLQNPDERRQLGLAARALVAGSYGFDSVIEQLEAVYRT